MSSALPLVLDLLRQENRPLYCLCLMQDERDDASFTARMAFWHQLNRALWIASQPSLALIRLQWWRDGLAKPDTMPAAHPVLAALFENDHGNPLLRQRALDLIDAIAAQIGDTSCASLEDWLALQQQESQRLANFLAVPEGMASGMAERLDTQNKDALLQFMITERALQAHRLSADMEDWLAAPLRDAAGLWHCLKMVMKAPVAAALPASHKPLLSLAQLRWRAIERVKGDLWHPALHKPDGLLPLKLWGQTRRLKAATCVSKQDG